MKVFGPIPSRRLGQSLGINNIPPKVCSYSCTYCQVGKSLKMLARRQYFYSPEELIEAVSSKVKKVQAFNENIDYLTFVPDGEPTLDTNLGKEIELLEPLGIKIAVITNSSLLWREDVRSDLSKADLVSVKIDTVDENTWKRVNSPIRSLQLPTILDGLLQFAENYQGKLITETMLIKDVNDSADQLNQVAKFIAILNPAMAYLAIPLRPTTKKTVKPPSENTINRGFQIFTSSILNVEYLIGYEGNAFAYTGDVVDDILSITAVHPMREDAMDFFLTKANAGKEVIEGLIAEGKIYETEYENKRFYVRKLKKGITV